MAFQLLALPEQAARLAFGQGTGELGHVQPRIELGAAAERHLPVRRFGWGRRLGDGDRAGEVHRLAAQVFALRAVLLRPAQAVKVGGETDGFLPRDEGLQGWFFHTIHSASGGGVSKRRALGFIPTGLRPVPAWGRA